MVRCGRPEFHNAGDSEGNPNYWPDRIMGLSPAEDPVSMYPARPTEQQDVNKDGEYPFGTIPPIANVWGTDETGLPYYRRDWQIGQPFRTNEFHDSPWNEKPRIICTPSIANGASRLGVYFTASLLFCIGLLWQ